MFGDVASGSGLTLDNCDPVFEEVVSREAIESLGDRKGDLCDVSMC